ncbi:hypothetical protein OROHE_006520 [Orobanche hederae]
MSRHRGVVMEGMILPTKIRKRGCSSSSSSSSRVYNYRMNKRAILVGKNRAGIGIGLGRSRSTTPVPAWRTTPLRTAIESPRCSQSGKSTRPISARKLAATLWEMSELPSPKMSERNLEPMKRVGSKMVFKKEKLPSGWVLHPGSGHLPKQLLDPSHSPTASEKMDRSGTGSRRMRTPSISQRLMSADQNDVRPIDSISNVSLMETETRSRPPTSSGSAITSKNRLKDISNALITSKELLKIINRMWARVDHPSPSTPLISALHVELEKARLHVNHLFYEQRSDKHDVNHLIKCFAEEKALWKHKEEQAIEAAIGTVITELDAERKLRRRLESLNKKLGKELAGVKSSFAEAVKELESEKRARKITEEVCDELARNMDEDRADVEKIKKESFKVHKEAEKEREMLELADKLREERVQMKLSEAKHHFEEKSSAVSRLRKQLEVFLRTKRDKDDEEDIDCQDNSAESDLHSIKLNADRSSSSNNNNNNNKGQKWKLLIINKIKGRDPSSGRRSVSLQRGQSDVEFLDRERFSDPEMDNPRSSSHFDEMQRQKAIKDLKDHMLSTSRLSLVRENSSCRLSLRKEKSCPSIDPLGTVQDQSSSVIQAHSLKLRTGVVRGEGQSMRRMKG